MKRHWQIIALAACTVFVLAACGDKKPSTPPAAPTAKQAAPAAAAAPAAVPATPEEQKAEKEVYAYDPQGRRDPFTSLVEVLKKKPVKKKGASPIENFDVEDVKLIAIAWDKQQYYALVMLPDNKSYTIRKGTTLGLYGGKVMEIKKDTVLIREQVTDYKGQSKTKDTLLKLRKEGDE